MPRRLIPLLCALAALVPGTALAQSCDTYTGQRYAETDVLKQRHTAELAKLRFAAPAKFLSATRDPGRRIAGVSDAGENYDVKVARTAERFIFTFRDYKGRDGALSFPMPATIGIFEIDPRGAESSGRPTLYKEWRLTSHAGGDGLFDVAVNRNTRITLVLHGRGNGCTDASQFTDWTLQVSGPRSKFSFYGKLEPTSR